MEDRGAWKVGLVTLLAIFGVFAMLGVLNPAIRATLTGGRWSFYVVFDDAGGLAPAEQVLLAGVQIGNIDKVSLVTDPASPDAMLVNDYFRNHNEPARRTPFALVKLNLDKSVKGDLFHSYSYEVGSSSLLGTSHEVNVVPGTAEGPVQQGDVVAGTAALGLSDIAQPAANMMEAITSLSKKMQDLTADPRLKQELLASLDQVHDASENMRVASEQVRDLATTANQSLSKDLPHVGGTLQNVEATTANIRGATDRLPVMMDEVQGSLTEVRHNLTSASQHADQAMQNVDATTARINTFANNSGTLEQLHDTIANFKQGSDHLAAVMTSIQNLTSSPQFQKDLPQMISNLNAASAELAPAIKQARDTLGTMQNVGETADSLLGGVAKHVNGGSSTGTPGGAKPRPKAVHQDIGVQDGIGLMYTGRPNHEFPHSGLVDPEFTFHLKSSSYYLGLYDLGGQDKLTAQAGGPLANYAAGSVNYRYGLYRSKAGAGLDLILDRGLGFYLNLYDLNSPTLDLETSLGIAKDYSLWAGLDQINRDLRPFVGVRIRP